MFREMRLKEENELPRACAVEILENNSYGVLALDGDGKYPYAVPVNYVYADDKIYFHCAAEGGHKLDSINRNERISFCVVEKADIVPEKFNCLFLSAIAFGKARVIADEGEKQQIMERIVQKYSADFMESGKAYIKNSFDDVCAVEIAIDHLTAKKGV